MSVQYTKQGRKGYYCSLVESVRIGKKVNHKTIARLGFIPKDRLPFLKAAFCEGNPDSVLAAEKAAMSTEEIKNNWAPTSSKEDHCGQEDLKTVISR